MLQKVIVASAALLLAGCASSGPTQHTREVVELDKAESTHVELRMGAGEMDVKGGASKLMEADFSYNVPAWKPTVTPSLTGAQGRLVVSQAEQGASFGNSENHWQVALNDARPMDVEVHVGAGESHLNLGSLNLRGVDINVGVGEVTLDLRGRPTTSYKVTINGGVGSATVQVPASVAISANAKGGVGSIKFTGLEERDGRWINPRAETSPVRIDLDVRGGVGEINIEAQ